MFIGKRRADSDQKKNLEDQRQRVIAFKKFFGTEHGQSVMTDLMNKYHVLNDMPVLDSEYERGRAEGKRDVVLYLLKQARTTIEDLDRLLKGEFL